MKKTLSIDILKVTFLVVLLFMSSLTIIVNGASNADTPLSRTSKVDTSVSRSLNDTTNVSRSDADETIAPLVIAREHTSSNSSPPILSPNEGHTPSSPSNSRIETDQQRNHLTTEANQVPLPFNPLPVQSTLYRPTTDTSISESTLTGENDSYLTYDTTSIEDEATHIVVGKVDSIEARWNENRTIIYSHVKIVVEEYLKGTPQGNQVIVRHFGGTVDEDRLWVSTEPSFMIDEHVKVLLKSETDGEFTVVGGWMGKISLDVGVSPVSQGYIFTGSYWEQADLPVGYYINQEGTPSTTGEFEAVQRSFQTWEDDPWSYMDYVYLGTTTRHFSLLSDGYNVISWGSLWWVPSAIAVAKIWWKFPSLSKIGEFDIMFNSDMLWSTAGVSGRYDVQNIGTHEAGHTLQLGDLYDAENSEETMYGYGATGETKKRTLNTGDIAGIRFIYPIPQPQLWGWEISPYAVPAGGTFTAKYKIHNSWSSSINVGLGCSIKPSSNPSNVISDPTHDVVVSAAAGDNWYSRYFTVPSGSPSGSYDIVFAIWSGWPGSSEQFDTTDWLFAKLTVTVPTNDPPSLTNGYVTPLSGSVSTPFSYYVTYSDPEGDIPSVQYVYIDGIAHSMTYQGGSYTTGATFSHQTTLSADTHNFYFEFSDGINLVRLPSSGSYSGPTVTPGGNLGDHCMCKGVQSEYPWDPIERTNVFYTDDPKAHSWLKFVDIYDGPHYVHWDWYDPDGVHWTWDETIPAPPTGEYWVWYKKSSNLGPLHFADSKLGRAFTTKVYYDGNLVVTETWTVIKHQSSITVSLSSNSITYDQSVTIDSQLSPSFSDGTTTLQYSTDGVNWNNIAAGTPSNGHYSHSWKPPAVGTYYVRAKWSGNLNYYGSTSSTKTLTVDKAATTLTTTLSSTPITYGASVTITASMSPQLQGKTVTIQYSLDNSNWYDLSSGTTNAAGEYAFSWTPAVGSYYIRSTWGGDTNYHSATSPSQHLAVNQASTSTSCTLSSDTINYGESVTVTGTVNVPVNDGIITLEYSTDGVDWDLISSGTPLGGSYSYTWTPPSSGTFYIRAVWSGNHNYLGSTSSSQTLTVALCQVSFYTDPAGSGFNITFQGLTYHNDTVGVFDYGTSGSATADCPEGWEFDSWVVSGNVEVTDDKANPTTFTVKCGGTLKAVFRITECYANIYIEHTYRGDLIVDLGAGDPASPDWSQRVWNGEGASEDNLDLMVDLSAATAYLPPSQSNRWFLKVYDHANWDQGQIIWFNITHQDTTYSSADTPVPINDLQTSYAYIPPPETTAHICIEHTWIGDLVVKLDINDEIYIPVWNREGGSQDNLNRTVDLSDYVANLPPSSEDRWSLEVYDAAGQDQGQIVEFSIAYEGQTYYCTEVPKPILDFQTTAVYIPPPECYAHIVIDHTWIGDLNVTIGVGDPVAPLWSEVVWNREGGSADIIDLTVDLSDAIAYLPPSKTNRWWICVYDGAGADQGWLVEFSITCHGQTYYEPGDPKMIQDFETIYSWIPEPPTFADIYIEHTYRGDLIVDLGVGDPASPDWSQRVWNGEGASEDNLDLTVDLSGAVAYLPPSETHRWFLKVYDDANWDKGQIIWFNITHQDTTYSSAETPVPINDLQTSYAYIPSVYEGAISAGELALHSFTVPDGATKIEISLEMPDGTDFDLSLRDDLDRRTGGWIPGDGVQRTDIPNSDYSGWLTSPELIVVEPPATSGTWQIGVYAYSGSGTYKVTVYIYLP